MDGDLKLFRLALFEPILNLRRSILHDLETYHAPEVFNPDRFLSASNVTGNQKEVAPDPDSAFGFGRRICPGKDMAYDAVWICIATILATLDIFAATDEFGDPIQVKGEYTS